MNQNTHFRILGQVFCPESGLPVQVKSINSEVLVSISQIIIEDKEGNTTLPEQEEVVMKEASSNNVSDNTSKKNNSGIFMERICSLISSNLDRQDLPSSVKEKLAVFDSLARRKKMTTGLSPNEGPVDSNASVYNVNNSLQQSASLINKDFTLQQNPRDTSIQRKGDIVESSLSSKISKQKESAQSVVMESNVTPFKRNSSVNTDLNNSSAPKKSKVNSNHQKGDERFATKTSTSFSSKPLEPKTRRDVGPESNSSTLPANPFSNIFT
ncbi:7502_t:CDS:1 [Ambispora leptoticha]|uniref:7502_t:CDS:1 n=1 Tax=Ambispora leptoticha TaxID=144679 RepID=A0A9N8Z4A7_9GLOM|nr:7502_t:CDS:1 [Ambispora leptoticha]